MPRIRPTAAVRRTAETIETRLAAAADPVRAPRQKAYLKSSLEHLGVAVPALRAVVLAALRAEPGVTGHDPLVGLAELLWQRPVFEYRLAAVEVLVARKNTVTTADLPLLERLLRESLTWALVDPLAGTVVGSLVVGGQSATEPAATLDRWSTDDDFWIRRSALLSQLPLLTREETTRADFASFARWADSMLDEQEFFIRKAIGWVLRETSKRHPEIVMAYLGPRVDRLSGVSWREAVRRLPPDLVADLPPRR